jgi:enoyl-CoA hydratase
MGYETILIETRGRVGLITLNRSLALNAINRLFIEELLSAAEAFDADPGVGCLGPCHANVSAHPVVG